MGDSVALTEEPITLHSGPFTGIAAGLKVTFFTSRVDGPTLAVLRLVGVSGVAALPATGSFPGSVPIFVLLTIDQNL